MIYCYMAPSIPFEYELFLNRYLTKKGTFGGITMFSVKEKIDLSIVV